MNHHYDQTVNPVLWVISNLAVLYIMVVMFIYVMGNLFFFEWEKYRGGRLVMAFTSSLLLTFILIGISLVTNPLGFFTYPPDTLIWRPALRTAIYLTVAVTTTNLSLELLRRWRARERFQSIPPRTSRPISTVNEDTTPKPRQRRKQLDRL